MRKKHFLFFECASAFLKTAASKSSKRSITKSRYILDHFRNFLNGRDIPIQKIDSSLIRMYEEKMNRDMLCRNSSSYYIRGLRSIYNKIAKKIESINPNFTLPANPFSEVYTGVDKTAKRALNTIQLATIMKKDLRRRKKLQFARDIFMFSYMTRGMSFIDIAFLKKNNLNCGIISYVRRKTGQSFHIKVEPELQKIIDRYKAADTNYLLPIISPYCDDPERSYRSAYKNINRCLNKLGKLLGIEENLTTYVARHSWASNAMEANIPIELISQSLGHVSINTTKIYLKTLNTSPINQANRTLIDNLTNLNPDSLIRQTDY